MVIVFVCGDDHVVTLGDTLKIDFIHVPEINLRDFRRYPVAGCSRERYMRPATVYLDVPVAL